MNESDIPDMRHQLESAVNSLGENITACRDTTRAHDDALLYGADVVGWFNGMATANTHLQGSAVEMGHALSKSAATETTLEDIVQSLTHALSDVEVTSDHHTRAAVTTVRTKSDMRDGREKFGDMTASIREMRAGIYAVELSARNTSAYLEQAGAAESVITGPTQQINGLVAKANTYNDTTREVIAPLNECQSTDLPELHARLTERVADLQEHNAILAGVKENIASALHVLEDALSGLRSYNALGQSSAEEIEHDRKLALDINEKAQRAVTRLEGYKSTPGEMKATATAVQKSIQQFSSDI